MFRVGKGNMCTSANVGRKPQQGHRISSAVKATTAAPKTWLPNKGSGIQNEGAIAASAET